jgi:hypothetical protein
MPCNDVNLAETRPDNRAQPTVKRADLYDLLSLYAGYVCSALLIQFSALFDPHGVCPIY